MPTSLNEDPAEFWRRFSAPGPVDDARGPGR